MAPPSGARIFRDSVDPQFEAFPNEPPRDRLRRINRLLSDPAIAVLRLQHEMLRLQRLGPYLDAKQVIRIQGEIELMISALDDVEYQVKTAARLHAKAAGLIV